MAKIKLSEAPGCIGSPVIRKEGHPICNNCAFTNVCAKLSKLNEGRLLESLGIDTLSDQTGKMLIKGANKMTIAQIESPSFKGKKPLTSRGAQMQNSMLRKMGGGNMLLKAMKAEERIVAEHAMRDMKPDWSRELMLLIWDNDGTVTKKDLRDYMHHELGHSKTLAVGYVSNFINATTNADVLKEDKEKLRLNDV
tara:strand:- start:5648 stop:6232 length:585 start_codon:yes stop_codon:yes gene_type:complete